MTRPDAIAKHAVELAAPPPHRTPRPTGVYILIRSGVALYVGVTSNIEERLATQRHGIKGKRPPKPFDRALWIPLQRADLGAYQGALVRSLRPKLNRRVPALCGRDLEILEQFGLPPHDELIVQDNFRRSHRVARRKARS